jgi:pseudaminic acid biosynthesis-associated methylase
MSFKTKQEEFWAGSFGTEYIERNAGANLLAANLALFATALRRVQLIGDCIEFGANIGLNLRALQLLYPKLRPYALEINPTAVAELEKVVPRENIFATSILDFVPKRTFDLVLIKGVLIHINPDFLPQTYKIAYKSTAKYLMICEYYNPTPMTVVYRGHDDRLFKRDFCGEILDKFPDLKLLDYGFCYHRDPSFPQDDGTWFLMEKRA